MKNLIILPNGEVHDLQSAFDSSLLKFSKQTHTLGRAPLWQLPVRRSHKEDMPLERDTINSLNNAALNLALNVRNATAPLWELWLCASIGIVLQLVALVIPGFTTYYWEWRKAGSPVANYGYPCFGLGSILVMSGVMGCGHVIEGITAEHDFEILDGGLPVGAQILRLQRACTVSDQHFESFAIFNSQGMSVIRTSRLNESKNYR
jgi:hypothetical protein